MRDYRFLLVALLLLGPFDALASDSPARIVENFYAWAIWPAPEDLGKGLAPVRQLLGQELLGALEAQRTY